MISVISVFLIALRQEEFRILGFRGGTVGKGKAKTAST
jgi:hypothetical protein